MTDTVKRLMALADEYADRAVAMNGGPDLSNDVGYYRQCLQDELTRLFTPLTDEQIITKWMDGRRVPVLNFAREIEACHGITGEKNEQAT